MWTYIFLSVRIYVGMQLLVHMCNSVFNILSNYQTVPHPLYHFTFPLAKCEGCTFSASVPTYVIFFFFFLDDSLPSGCEVVSRGLNFTFP